MLCYAKHSTPCPDLSRLFKARHIPQGHGYTYVETLFKVTESYTDCCKTRQGLTISSSIDLVYIDNIYIVNELKISPMVWQSPIIAEGSGSQEGVRYSPLQSDIVPNQEMT